MDIVDERDDLAVGVEHGQPDVVAGSATEGKIVGPWVPGPRIELRLINHQKLTGSEHGPPGNLILGGFTPLSLTYQPPIAMA